MFEPYCPLPCNTHLPYTRNFQDDKYDQYVTSHATFVRYFCETPLKTFFPTLEELMFYYLRISTNNRSIYSVQFDNKTINGYSISR